VTTLLEAGLPQSQAVERMLPYRAEQLFDLAADVERYPEFLPLWIAARIRKREPGVDHTVYHTEQTVGFGPVRLRFESRTVLRRPERIDVASDDPRFRGFSLSWTFEPQPGGKCRVRLAAAMEFRSPLLQRAAGRALAAVTGEIIAAFEARARRLYGRA
jgi:coenzyme Q-binding protein COQ10